MSKEQWFRTYERMIAEYCSDNPGATWTEAHEKVAHEVDDRMREDMADKIDMERMRRKEGGE